jgi:hypothetical protein
MQETRLSALRPPSEFFDHNRLSRPSDFNQAVSVRLFFVPLAIAALTDGWKFTEQRISYNTRYFSGTSPFRLSPPFIYCKFQGDSLICYFSCRELWARYRRVGCLRIVGV